MRIFSEVCGGLLLASLILVMFVMVFYGIRSKDRWERWFLLFFGVGGLLATGFIGGMAMESDRMEAENPCVAWGPPETHYQLVGKIAVPVTRTPCVQRQNTTDR